MTRRSLWFLTHRRLLAPCDGRVRPSSIFPASSFTFQTECCPWTNSQKDSVYRAWRLLCVLLYAVKGKVHFLCFHLVASEVHWPLQNISSAVSVWMHSAGVVAVIHTDSPCNSGPHRAVLMVSDSFELFGGFVTSSVHHLPYLLSCRRNKVDEQKMRLQILILHPLY